MGRSYNHWTEAEVAALKEGVVRFGVGNWQKIVNDYPVLRQRTGVQLKDKVSARGADAGAGAFWAAWRVLQRRVCGCRRFPVLLPARRLVCASELCVQQ